MSNYFLIATLSVMLVMMQATTNTPVHAPWVGTSQILADKSSDDYLINIQGNLDDGLDLPSSIFSEDSDNINQSLGDVTREGETEEGDANKQLNSDTGTENMNQSTSDFSLESNEESNQSLETQDKVQTSEQYIGFKKLVKDNNQKEQRLEKVISEEEGEEPIPEVGQRKIEPEDQIVMGKDKSLTGENCRIEDVPRDASNEKDPKVLGDCQEAVGIVKYTKKIDDGDFKFFLELDEKYKFLVNEKNTQKN